MDLSSSASSNFKARRGSQGNMLFLRKDNKTSSSSLLNNFLSSKINSKSDNSKYNSYIPKNMKRNSRMVNKEFQKNNLQTIILDQKRKRSLNFTQFKLQNKLKEDLSVQINSLNEEMNKSQIYNINNNININSNTISNIKDAKDSKFKNTTLSKKNDKNKEPNRKIFRKKYLYDSLEDSEEFNEVEKDNFYISPESKIIIIIDFLIILCLNICLVYIPIKISYYKNNCVNIKLIDVIIAYSIDGLFIIDFLLAFFRAYYNNQFNLITKNTSIIKNYLKTYFIFDLVSAIPFLSFIIYYFKNICCPYNINNNRHILIGISFIFKLAKYKKVRDINKFMDIINEFFSGNYYAEQIYSAIKMFIKYLCVLHSFVCLHIFMGYHSNPSWLTSVQANFGADTFFSIYICSFYFLITTLTTVGYGDIVCISFIERIFQIIELALGVVLYSYIVSKLGSVIRRESYSQITYNNNLANLEEIRISYPKMPYKLYHRILQHIQKNAFQQQKTNINLLINNLPPMLKHSLLFVVHKNYIENFKFFKKCYNSNFIVYCLTNFKPMSSKKSTLLLKEDQLIDNVIFIGEGRLSFEIAIDLENPENSIRKYLSHQYNPLKNEAIIKDKYDESKNQKFSTLKMIEKNSLLSLNNTTIKGHEKVDRDFEESNYQFLNVSSIFKNENYGEVFVIYNKPSPLFLRVKSKVANCLLLNKTHILHLSANYSNIWNRLFKKSLKNMIALKEKTIDIVKKYSFRYNIKSISPIQEDTNSKENASNEMSVKNFHGELKKILSKNIENFKSNRYSIASTPAIKVNQKPKSTTENIDKIEPQTDNKNIDNNLPKITIQEEKQNDENNKNNNNNNEFPNVSEISSEISSKSSIEKRPENMDDKTYIKILEEKLEKEKKKRKYYQKLYEELNKKNKHLYYQVLTNNLKISCLNNSEMNSSNNSNINNVSKMLLNTINSHSPTHNRRFRRKTENLKIRDYMNLRDENGIKWSDTETPKNLMKSKTKKMVRKKTKFYLDKTNRSRSITKNYFNITKNINIINKIENVEKNKQLVKSDIKDNKSKNEGIIQKSLHLSKESLDNNISSFKEEKISGIIHNNSQSPKLHSKAKGKKVCFNIKDDKKENDGDKEKK